MSIAAIRSTDKKKLKRSISGSLEYKQRFTLHTDQIKALIFHMMVAHHSSNKSLMQFYTLGSRMKILELNSPSTSQHIDYANPRLLTNLIELRTHENLETCFRQIAECKKSPMKLWNIYIWEVHLPLFMVVNVIFRVDVRLFDSGEGHVLRLIKDRLLSYQS